MRIFPSQVVSVVGVLDPDTYAAGTYETPWIDMGAVGDLMAMISTGTLGASATVDAKFEQATDSSGTGAKDVAGAAMTQLTKASNDDDQVLIDLRAGKLDLLNGFSHGRLSVTVGTASSVLAATVLGMYPMLAPASKLNVPSVVQIVSA